MADLTRLLGEVVRVDAGLPEVVDAYELENFFADLRRPVFGRRLKSLKIQGLCVSINVIVLIYDDKFSSSMRTFRYADLSVLDLRGGHNTKDNDLWIAATAKATGAVLLTCDHDFDWLNPATITVYWIAQVK